jgi:hypothetical protein
MGRQVKRLALVDTFKQIPPSIVGLEMCVPAPISKPRA